MLLFCVTLYLGKNSCFAPCQSSTHSVLRKTEREASISQDAVCKEQHVSSYVRVQPNVCWGRQNEMQHQPRSGLQWAAPGKSLWSQIMDAITHSVVNSIVFIFLNWVNPKTFHHTLVYAHAHEINLMTQTTANRRVPDQNGVSQAWYIMEIHHSGRKHSWHHDANNSKPKGSWPEWCISSMIYSGDTSGRKHSWRKQQQTEGFPTRMVYLKHDI